MGDDREPLDALLDECDGEFEQLYKKKNATHGVTIYTRNEKGRLRQRTVYFRKL